VLKLREWVLRMVGAFVLITGITLMIAQPSHAAPTHRQ